MRLRNQTLRLRMLAWLLAPALAFGISSCSQDDTSSPSANDDGQPGVRFTAAGIAPGDSASIERSAPRPETVTKDLGNGLVLEATLSRDAATKTRSTMANNNVYRVIIYKAGAYVTYKDYTAGSENIAANKIPLQGSTAYTWVAYSYNTTSISDSYTGGTTSLSVDPSNDLLVASGSFTTNANGGATTAIGITFAHQFAQVTVVADATLNQYTISSGASATLTPANALTLTCATGAVAAGASATQTISFPSSGITSTSTPRWVLASGTAPTVTFNTISLADNTGAGTTPPSAVNKGVTFTSGLTAGYKYTLKAKLKHIDQKTAGGLKWAVGNLYETSTSGVYAIYNKMEAYHLLGNVADYWTWGAQHPATIYNNAGDTDYSTTSSWGTDPCATALGTGWRIPTQGDFTALNGVSKVYASRNGINGYYFGTSSDPGSSSTTYLFLPCAGERFPGSTTPLNDSQSSPGSPSGYYWSSTNNTPATTQWAGSSYELNFGYNGTAAFCQVNYNVIGYGMSIRCVSN